MGGAGAGPAGAGVMLAIAARGDGTDPSSKALALARKHPRLLHMTEAGNGEAIRERGLWCTRALLERNGVEGAARAAVEAARRPRPVRLPDGAVIRDNGVLREALLAPLLPEGVAPRDWYLLLNAHVFFWPSEAALGRLLGAGAYRAATHDVLEFDAASLLAAHAERVRLTPMNTGATGRTRPERGPDAFVPLSAWPVAAGTHYWTTPSGKPRPVREVAVLGGVPDAGSHLLRITRHRAGGAIEPVWPQ